MNVIKITCEPGSGVLAVLMAGTSAYLRVMDFSTRTLDALAQIPDKDVYFVDHDREFDLSRIPNQKATVYLIVNPRLTTVCYNGGNDE